MFADCPKNVKKIKLAYTVINDSRLVDPVPYMVLEKCLAAKLWKSVPANNGDHNVYVAKNLYKSTEPAVILCVRRQNILSELSLHFI